MFDTIMFAVGREVDSEGLGLKNAGVETDSDGKVIAGEDDRTSVENIYAIGDCVKGRLELTPTAI